MHVGCGKFFEGNAAEMHEALNKRLASLPDDTVVYVSLSPNSFVLFLCHWRWLGPETGHCSRLNSWEQPGHEYTKSNVKFAISVLQSEAVKKLQAFAESNEVTTGKFTIGDEKVCSLSLYFIPLLFSSLTPSLFSSLSSSVKDAALSS